MNGKLIVSGVALAMLILIITAVEYAVDPVTRAGINEHFAEVQMADDASRYETKKKVEDTARAMIASYEADRLTWEQYRDSDDEEKQSWAEQAMMRANKTASTYNNYILQNSFVWKDNIPAYINGELEILKEE